MNKLDRLEVLSNLSSSDISELKTKSLTILIQKIGLDGVKESAITIDLIRATHYRELFRVWFDKGFLEINTESKSVTFNDPRQTPSWVTIENREDFIRALESSLAI